MLKARYRESFAAGIICAGGTLGILIPPSIMLIVYAATSGVSIVRLYAGALLPGFLLVGLYILYVMARAILQPTVAPRPAQGGHPASTTLPQLVWMMLTSFVPLARPDPGGARLDPLRLRHPVRGCRGRRARRHGAGRRLRRDDLAAAARVGLPDGAHHGDGLLAVRRLQHLRLGLRLSRRQQLIADFVLGIDLTPLTFLIMAQIVIFILGWPLEWTEIIIIFVPIFLPLLPHFGIDPLFFGILVALNLQTAFLSPPMAMSAYYLKGIAPPHVQLNQIFRGCMPFMTWVLVAMVIVYVFPGIVYWLPNLVYGREARRRRLAGLGAVEARDRIARGALKAAEYAEALTRAHRRDASRRSAPGRGSTPSTCGARAPRRSTPTGRRAAHSAPLHGLPVGLKDIIDTADIPTENGTPIDAGRRPTQTPSWRRG